MDHRDLRDRKGHPDHQDHLVLTVNLEYQENLGHLELLVRRVFAPNIALSMVVSFSRMALDDDYSIRTNWIDN
uniref:Neur_chan_LBD domain-containing protein n=1 Tax=Elaeophora elaphi TaxID=1147741 RepID=A0A0R3RMS6_9BILA